jgi:RHS repeat-associated protein
VSGATRFDPWGNQLTGSSDGWGWIGAKQRATDTLTGLVVMGVRLYNSVTGLFLQQDPIYGGNDTTYGYPTDPINRFDLDGRIDWGGLWDGVASALGMSTYDLNHKLVDIFAAVSAAVFVGGICALSAGMGCGLVVGLTVHVFTGWVGHTVVDGKMRHRITVQSTLKWAGHDTRQFLQGKVRSFYWKKFMNTKMGQKIKTIFSRKQEILTSKV